jgi:serine/threonine protein kinase
MAQLSSHPLPPSALSASALKTLRENRAFGGTELAIDPSGVESLPVSDPEASASARTFGGRYEIISYIDGGGTADVYAAVDRRNGGRVALKILKPKTLADERLCRYFLHGARGAKRVHHPNLVRVIDVIESADEAPFAVMEIVEGQALSSLLQNHGTVPPHVAIELTLQAAAGLDAAHRSGMVHCDVKPENLLVEVPPGGAPRLRVIDFDLAAIDDEPETHEHPLLRGTAKYMAPEQVLGDRVDARTDVYGLGVVMFRMLTGHLPFDLELCPTLLFHQFASPAPPVSWLADGLDPSLEAIVLKALRKSPDNRYASMAELIADLRALESGLPLRAHDPISLPDVYVPATSSAEDAARAISRCV